MSRIGKQPVELPSGVSTNITGDSIEVKGPKGTLKYGWGRGVTVALEDGKVVVAMSGKDAQAKANYGTTRAHINNMVVGVTEGWTRGLELNGVGFTASMKGQTLVLNTGYSHETLIEIPKGVNCKADKIKITLESIDKEQVGTLAAKIRRVCPPEPYLGKGIKYEGEHIRRKAGKTGK